MIGNRLYSSTEHEVNIRFKDMLSLLLTQINVAKNVQSKR